MKPKKGDIMMLCIAKCMIRDLVKKYTLRINRVSIYQPVKTTRYWLKPWKFIYEAGACDNSSPSNVEIAVRNLDGELHTIEDITDIVCHEMAHLNWGRIPAYGDHDSPKFKERYLRYKRYICKQYGLDIRKVQ